MCGSYFYGVLVCSGDRYHDSRRHAFAMLRNAAVLSSIASCDAMTSLSAGVLRMRCLCHGTCLSRTLAQHSNILQNCAALNFFGINSIKQLTNSYRLLYTVYVDIY